MAPCGQVVRLARARQFDQRHGGCKCGVCIEFGGIEDMSIIGRFEWRHRAIGVTLVPPLDVGQSGVEIGRFTSSFELAAAPPRWSPRFPRCGPP